MFVVVGERINTTRKKIAQAVEAGDAAYIQDDVRKQAAAGATYIDVNAGSRGGREKQDLAWLIEVIQESVDLPLCLDSPDPEVLRNACEQVKNPPMINSISLEKNRYEPMLDFLKGRKCKIIALCMSDEGMPQTVSEVVGRAQTLISGLEKNGIQHDNIYVDPLVEPVGVDIKKGLIALDSIREITSRNPGVHIMCGLSNISFGLPQRKAVNRQFLTLLLSAGADGAILDPLDRQMMAGLRITEMLLGQDAFCMRYISAVRSGLLG